MKPGLTLLSLLWMKEEPVSDPVDPEVLDRACDAAWKACWPEFPHRPGSTGDRHIRRALESAGPIVAAAAYRQGKEDGLREARERIEYLQPNVEPNFHVNASPEAKAKFDGMLEAWRVSLDSLAPVTENKK